MAEYREEGDGGSSSQDPWEREEVPPGEQPPKITVEALKPNTLYEACSFVHSLVHRSINSLYPECRDVLHQR